MSGSFTTFVKDPDAVLDYKFDWAALTNGSGSSDWLQAGETLSSHTIHTHIDISQLFVGQSEPFPNLAFYPIAVYRSSGTLFRYTQSKTGRRTAIFSPKYCNAGIGGLSRLLKDPREICGSKQPQITRKPRLCGWQ